MAVHEAAGLLRQYHADLAGFRSAVEAVLGAVSTTHAASLATLTTLNFQEFDEVPLLAA